MSPVSLKTFTRTAFASILLLVVAACSNIKPPTQIANADIATQNAVAQGATKPS